MSVAIGPDCSLGTVLRSFIQETKLTVAMHVATGPICCCSQPTSAPTRRRPITSRVDRVYTRTVSDRPVGPYALLSVDVVSWDPRAAEVAAEISGLITARRPDLAVEHIGSTAVPGLPGKGVVDLGIATEPPDVPRVAALLRDLGF